MGTEFNYDDMESDYYEGHYRLPSTGAGAGGGRWHDTCKEEGCVQGYPNRFGYCAKHSAAVPPPAAKTGVEGVFDRGGKYAAAIARDTFPRVVITFLYRYQDGYEAQYDAPADGRERRTSHLPRKAA